MADVRIGDVRLSDGRVLRPTGVLPAGDSGSLVFHGPKRMTVLVSLDQTPHGELLHVSVSYPDRLPSWRDLRLLKEVLFAPHQAAAMILPEEGYYVNNHDFCLHLWEIPGGWKFSRTV